MVSSDCFRSLVKKINMNILTFDIEDWWVYDRYRIGEKSDWRPRLDGYLNRILDLLDERNIKATFFILGEVAKCSPEIVKQICQKGHHIGCHSFSHIFFGKATPEQVMEDTKKAIETIENVIGRKVDAYRAPAFSITEKNSWILSVLLENGIKYDCSIFPATRSYGGFPSYKTKVPSIIEVKGEMIKEFPIAPVQIFGHEIVYSGGGYFRLFPYIKIKSFMEQNDYVMTYFHIKDFDYAQKKTYRSFEGESALSRYIKKYYGLKNCFPKFCRLVSQFDFVSVEQADKLLDWNQQPCIKL